LRGAIARGTTLAAGVADALADGVAEDLADDLVAGIGFTH